MTIHSMPNNKNFDDNYPRIFGKKKECMYQHIPGRLCTKCGIITPIRYEITHKVIKS